MSKETLIALAARCEAAGGPDRELDCLIYCATAASHFEYWGGECVLAVQGGFSARLDWKDLPHPTASIDAASSLVPTELFRDLRPGEWWWSVDNLGCDAHVAYENHDSGIPEYSGSAATPALALCAAALKARAQSEQNHDG